MKNNVGSKFFNIIQDIYDICQSAVKISNRHSEYFNVEMGVKQGDSLIPTLFNYYIKDIHDGSCDPLQLDSIYISSLSFADDLIIFSDSHTGLQNAINNLKKYCYDWQLTVNVNKTKILTLQKVFTPTTTVFYDNKPLKEVTEYNYLGNAIGYKGNFKRCIQEIAKKGLKV